MSFNKITIVGYLGRDPELRYTPQGTAVCKLSVATTERRKNAAGQPEEHTTWFRVTVWGRQAELANEYLARGRQVYLEGRLRLEEYTDRDGNLRMSPEVNATDIQFLGNRGEASTQNGQNQNGRSSEQNHQAVELRPEEEEEPEDRPAPPRPSGKATRKREAAAKELVSIEEDDIPF
jgi:single-strand DNA-binding protein